ncbi:SGNH/GDSL hydrolase family protein [Asaia krungthepensis]|uniref:SGNH hydrolase-type esterase domain-containing protein n=1 Tax=Asaia krungthepensis NRIC 0535 TaxID=1307925 RepID=A0ABQ0Q4W6_9PROT|nr:GDSL-type esterase/lipase family protein [Asaia krungthepensis]GBQ91525.1 hypothetical protein AA0535_2323 [Asaia krungthepensis NRIC 0535]
MPRPILTPQQRDVCNRAPDAADDITLGYVKGDLWQSRGSVWRAEETGPGEAVWRLIAQADHPRSLRDDADSNLAAAWGSQQIISGYAGPLMDVAFEQDAKLSFVTIRIDEHGALCKDGADLFIAGHGKRLSVTRLYDQSGHGAHAVAQGYDPATQALDRSRCPEIGSRFIGDVPVISWTGEPRLAQGMQFTLPQQLDATKATVLFEGAFSAANTARPEGNSLLWLDAASGNSIAWSVGGHDCGGGIRFSDPNLTGEEARRSLVPDVGPSLLTLRPTEQGIAVMDGTGQLTTQISLSSCTQRSLKAITGGAIGGNRRNGGCSAALQMRGLKIFTRTMDDPDVASAMVQAISDLGIFPQRRERLDCIGSSTTQGFGAEDGWSWPQILAQKLPSHLSIHNWGVPGATAQDCLTNTLNAIVADQRRFRSALGITWLGNNDIGKGHSIDQIVANNIAIHRQLKRAGYRRLFMIAQYNETLRAAMKRAADNREIIADMVIDPWSEGPLSDRGDRSLFYDGTHLTRKANQLLAAAISTAISSFL